MHPELRRFIDAFEQEARGEGRLRHTLGYAETRFLERVWGPFMNFNFDGLKPEYPFLDFEGGQRFVDFFYSKGPVKLIIEIDGYTTHAKEISKSKFRDHVRRQNRLMYSGWFLLRFTADEVETEEGYCQAELLKAIGYCWTTSAGAGALPLSAGDLWAYRKKAIELYAVQQGDRSIHPTNFAYEHGIGRTTAQRWFERAAEEGLLTSLRRGNKVYGYMLADMRKLSTGRNE
ncbi:DUF559 domain-containing protein [Paenibacillus sp.]|uniref:DUF559 domain-containing protein n=1 Tax=Paenibacillus sp. TaxID=58172 RepID=UPI0028115A92|nr:DUF559 domain-containing protein [Paenibacillus sp.]